MGLGPAYGTSSGGGPPAGGWTRADLADPGGMPVVRRGARFGANGDYAVVIWTVSGFPYSLRAAVIINKLPSVDSDLLGQAANGSPLVRVSPTGQLRVWGDAAQSAFYTSAGTIIPGEPILLELEITSTSTTAKKDGVVVGFLDGQVNTLRNPGRIDIGTRGTGSLDCTIWNVEFTDPASATNSAFFPLDGRDSSGNYPNTLAGSSVADATVSGTVLDVEVNSTASGGGGPVPVGPVVVMALRTTTQAFTALGVISLTGVVDPYSWVASSKVSPTVGGVGVFLMTGRIRATALAGSSAEIQVRIDEVGVGPAFTQPLTLDTLNEWVSFSIVGGLAVEAGDDFQAVLSNFTPGDAVEVGPVYFTLTLYPDLS